MNQERLEFLKKIATHFRENPNETHYLGVSRETCFSVLALHVSTPEEILDPTHPEFLPQAEEKINQHQEAINQNQSLSKTVNLPPTLENTVQHWQKFAATEPNSSQREKIGRHFNDPLRRFSLETWQKVKPEWTPDLGRFMGKSRFFAARKRLRNKVVSVINKNKYLNKTAKVLGKTVKTIGKVAGVAGSALLALAAPFISAKIIKDVLKYGGAALYGLYMLFASLGAWAAVGFVAGAIVGGIAGGIAGAILAAKLAAIIFSPLLAIPVIGPILYAIGVFSFAVGGFFIGGAAGAAILGTATGLLAYAAEHWLWNPIQGAWSQTGSLLGGAGNFFGGLWSGFWTGAGNLASSALIGAGNLASGALIGAGNLAAGALTWAGGAAVATGNFFAGLGASLSSISLAPLATLPVLGTIGIAGGFTLFLGPFVVGTAFMRKPPPPVAIPPVGSQYITLSKTPQPTVLQNSEVEGSGKDITYTILIGAPTATLTNVRVTDQTTKTTGTSITDITTDKNGNPITSWAFAQIIQGQTQTITYQIHADSSFKNSTITDIVTVLADVPSTAKTNETSSVRAIVYISDVQIAGSCGICNFPSGSLPFNSASLALRNLLVAAGTAYGVPAPVLAGVMNFEGQHIFGYTDSQVLQYSQPGAQDPINCTPNGCGARGPMQFLNDTIATNCGSYTGTLMPDVWAGYANAVKVADPSRTPDVCNIEDAVYAAAQKLRGDSGAAAGCSWTLQDVYNAAGSYYGNCSSNYCAVVWQYYQTYQCP